MATPNRVAVRQRLKGFMTSADSKTAPHDADDTQRLITASSASRALNLMGDRWVLMISSLAFVGVTRFEEFQSSIGIARSLLTSRLRRLEAAGVLERSRYCERPPRDEYLLTEMGRDLFGPSMMIIRWEKRWFHDPKVRAHNLKHTCGHTFMPECRCNHCRKEIIARETVGEPGPGAGFEAAPQARSQRRSTVDNKNGTDAMIERSIEVLGDRWIAHVIAHAFYGRRRFSEFQQALGVATNILSERLNRLVSLGILEQRLYQESPARYEYKLTEKGLDLFPLVLELVRWGARWMSGPEGPPEQIRHLPCQQIVTPVITCSHCGEEVTRESITGLR